MSDAAALAAAGSADRERTGRLEPALVDAMRAEGVFSALVPAALGGGEVSPAELVATVEELAAADGAVGWCAGVGATAGLAAAYLPEAEASELFGDPPAIAAGVFAPRGKLEPAGEGAYRLTGRWPLASGITHAEVVGLGAVDPERGPLYAVVPRGAVEVVETWDSLGLRATGSHDVSVEGLEVPAARVVDLAGGDPTAEGPLYAFPLFGLLALSVSAVCTGLALGALVDLREVAAARTPLGSRRALAERGTAQESVASAEALLRAARSGVDAAIATAWSKATTGGPLSTEERLGLRLAATHAARASVDVVDLAHRLSGSGGLYAGAAERRLRDVHTAAQHMVVAPATFELAGRILLGVQEDDPQL
ncbi:MAG: acyl-CoA dehydrogenase family protein [Solirubrobacterales bacterium]